MWEREILRKLKEAKQDLDDINKNTFLLSLEDQSQTERNLADRRLDVWAQTESFILSGMQRVNQYVKYMK